MMFVAGDDCNECWQVCHPGQQEGDTIQYHLCGLTCCNQGHNKFDLDSKNPLTAELVEFDNMSADFAPYARALIKTCEVIEWHSDKDYQEASVNKIIRQFELRHDIAHQLQQCLRQEIQASGAAPEALCSTGLSRKPSSHGSQVTNASAEHIELRH